MYAKKIKFIKDRLYMLRRDNADSSVLNKAKVFCMSDEYAFIEKIIRQSPDQEKKYIKAFQAKKWGNYQFTYRRIAKEYHEAFLQRIAIELKSALEKKEIDAESVGQKNYERIQNIVKKYVDHDTKQQYIVVVPPSVSVIIPVYNGAEYLKQCLDSVLNQTLSGLEIICINDASTDNSGEILELYQKKRSNFKIITNTVNLGAGASRNIGLELANGDYLSFLDADDFFEKDGLKIMYDKAKKDDLDFVVSHSDFFDDIEKKLQPVPWIIHEYLLPQKEIFSASDVKENIFNLFVGWAWDKLYKRDFILDNNLRFQEILSSNDMYFVFMALIQAQRIAVVKNLFAHHRRNKFDSVSNTREKHFENFYLALSAIKHKLRDLKLYKKFEQDFVNYATHAILWNAETLKGFVAINLYKKVVSEWDKYFAISGHTEGYFYNKKEFQLYRDIFVNLR